jgi:hypothetical protein
MSPEQHLFLYGEFYRAYLLNKHAGAVEARRYNQRVMRFIAALGTLSKSAIRSLQRRTRHHMTIVNASLDGFLAGMRAAEAH